jgi:hypothetical protein
MERDHKPRGRFSRFVDRGLQYAAQTAAGREGAPWAIGDTRVDGAISRTPGIAVAEVTATVARTAAAPVPGMPGMGLGEPGRQSAPGFAVRIADPR